MLLIYGVGVTQADLIVLEDGVAYSVNKEKEATRFYIMQCTKPVNDEAIQVSINDVMNRFSYQTTISYLFLFFFLSWKVRGEKFKSDACCFVTWVYL